MALKIYQLLFSKDGYFGDYSSWEEAYKASGGYDSELILNKVRNALLKVKNREAVFERDGVLFDEIQYSWPLLAGLLWIASRNNNRLNLLDFGGSLGSSYFQNTKFLGHLDELKWNVVEQEIFVRCGKEYFEDQHLKFYYSIDDCMNIQNPDAVLLGSVIQYIEKPYSFLSTLFDKGFKFIILDRTPFLTSGEDRITVQRVPPVIYDASYPAWFFNLDKFKNFFSTTYSLVAEFDTPDKSNIQAKFKGFIFERRQNR